ncbi:eukaryotic translation initiation factor 3 subunit B [Nephila pilipes]|uniref:Eukaryotic translation initiation factor 3 subunit B n=1 Tax=Nephila pilipes TaxID=299642 RepID=A0A8X6JIY9_NEPPI|nr:eukaryotic translation initiation factor 3 subunit B [Nephila pilipes]
MTWQKCGGYLVVKVDRYSKARKEKNEYKYSGMYYNFEIFHMREKQIPVDSIEIKENITALSAVVNLYIEGKVIPTEFLVLPEAKRNKTLLGRDFLNAAGIVLDVQGGKWYFSENPRRQYEFFQKHLEEIAISAFELREDEVTYEIADPANPDQVHGTYHISALKDYHEPGVERDTGPVAPLRKRGRLKKLPPGSEPRRQRNQRGSL